MEGKIGERISYESKGKNWLEVEIAGKIESWKESLIFFWLVAWTFCGIYVFTLVFEEMPREMMLFLVVYLVFWAYFEYIVAKVWLWRRFGKERILLEDGLLLVKNDVRGYGKVRKYFQENIRNLGIVTKKTNNFSFVYEESFWVIGGEKVGFESLGKKIAFGRQLKEEEAKSLVRLLKKHLTKK